MIDITGSTNCMENKMPLNFWRMQKKSWYLIKLYKKSKHSLRAYFTHGTNIALSKKYTSHTQSKFEQINDR